MCKKFSGLIIVSDIDGTLMEAKYGIPQRNIDAINYFVENGGKFSLATGRSTEYTRKYTEQININAPCILFNGSVIYDYVDNREYSSTFLPSNALEYVKEILKDFPNAGAYCPTADEYLYLGSKSSESTILFFENSSELKSANDIEALKFKAYKCVFMMELEDMVRTKEYLSKKTFEGVRFVSSAQHLLEMLPFSCSKGTGILEISRVTNTPIENIIAIGDYYNDEEMLRTAGFSVTVENAPDDIKSLCKLVVGSHLDGAVADLIEYIDKNGGIKNER